MRQPAIRVIREGDLPQAMRLKEIAGWNQTVDDWRLLMKLEPQGCWVAEKKSRVVATTSAVRYENRFAWIGMVIVDPEFRRQGIATRMVEHAIQHLESRGCPCQRLDATEAGARVYEAMGFEVERQVERWQRPAGLPLPDPVAPHLERLEPPGWTALAELDRIAFGADRRPLLEWYCEVDTPRFVVQGESGSKGYVAGRPGSGAFQIGPCVASHASAAENLLQSAVSALGPIEMIADVFASNAPTRDLLEGMGFSCRRVLQRMHRGENLHPGDPTKTFCLAGFELG